ncbi:TM2 domain-containing protein [Bifidobacterium simiarum]|nr:TM2 domain-containing protein [Bifidobacterium simiarum]
MTNNEPQKYSETPNRVPGEDANRSDQSLNHDSMPLQQPSFQQPEQPQQPTYSQSAQDAFLEAEQAAAQYTGTEPQFGAGAVPNQHGPSAQGPQSPYSSPYDSPYGSAHGQPQNPPSYGQAYGQSQSSYGQQYGQSGAGVGTGTGDRDAADNPYAQNPYGQNPYGQNGYAQNGYQQFPPYGQSQYGQPQYGQPQYAYGYGLSSKSKIAAGLLGIFLGCFGVHNFYLGNTGKALAQLLLTVVGWIVVIGPAVAGLWGLVEGILIIASKPGSPWHRDANGYELQD